MRKIYFSVLMLVPIICGSVYAGPTVIRDNRVTDTATTPVLGRGYSIGTNTYQSTCLKDVRITEPSYDMEYNFQSIESSQESSSEINQNSKNESKGSVSNTYKSGDSKNSNGLNWAMSQGSKTTIKNKVKYYNHRILVTINLYTYYASVDESKSPMSDTARELLVNKDLPGFFNSCGAYYVRSIGRKSTFLSIFTYQTRDENSDSSFESQLKAEVQAFNAGAFEYYGDRSYDHKAGIKVESKTSSDFATQASEKSLTIETHAYGLGKDEKASLVSYDLATFKAAIKDAFISMQNPNTGKVISIEVVPWVENTEFQSAVELEEKDIKAEGGKDGETEPLQLYEKKHILTQNAEFLIEVERADRNMMNMYYKAKLCRANIDANWKTDGQLAEGYKDAMISNNRTGATQTLKKLDDLLTDAKIKQLFDNEKIFMYGSKTSAAKGDAGGASACIKGIMKSGFFKTSYRDIKACEPVIGQLGEIQSDVITDFCMPTLVP